eukprot:TRINITY_DN7726_c0_g1_i2.p1 TRINITY_DN7726_c0_g1~~TRINITY_DN7726_c0_g1_i2.p1  ORF type:complete len:438 (-),score=96.23 TRINITY_DN7726_c0_g1_i2:233-1546(-)
MGNSEDGTPSKSEKASSPVQEQTNIHAYPDWNAIQAYYGPGVNMPPPYFNSAITPGHTPHPYMWGPQQLMPPYGTPFAAIYSHGGVYAHPSMPPLGSHLLGHGITSSATTGEAVMAIPLSMETPAKSSSNKDRDSVKKLKGFDVLAVSIGSVNAENMVGGASFGQSQSSECGTEGSSDGSYGNTAQGGSQRQRKIIGKDKSATGKDGKVDAQGITANGGEANAFSNGSLGVTVASVAGKQVGTATSTSMTPGIEFLGSISGKAKTGTTTLPPTGAIVSTHDGLPSEMWIQAQDERELKREKRKQSNRESARRSRLRKQAESEELAMKVESLSTENMALRSELNRLTENSEKLRRENSALMEKLKNAQPGHAGETTPTNIETEGTQSTGIANLLSKIQNNSRSVGRNGHRENEAHEKSSGKFHRLLESNARSDAVAAG